jgi:hypothetical protein
MGSVFQIGKNIASITIRKFVMYGSSEVLLAMLCAWTEVSGEIPERE